MEQSTPTNSEIKKGSVYLLISATVVKFEEFLANIIIARWLFPEDFGLYGLIIMVLTLFSTLGNWGIGTFIIYKKEEGQTYLPTALIFNIVLTTSLGLILFATGPLTASFFNDGRLINLQIVAGFIFIFQSISIIPHALLQTQFKLSLIAIINFVVLSAGFLLSLILAKMGFGVYSLLIPSLMNAVLLNLFYWPFAAWKPKIVLSFPKVKDILSYGKSIFGADLNSFLLQNVDFFIIAKFLSIPVLGFYKLAFSFAMALVAMLGEVISRVTMPTFSMVKDHKHELQQKFQQSLEYVSALAAPLFSVLMVSAPIFIPLFYGGKWNEIVLPFQIFCVLAFFSVLGKPCNSLLNAIGKPQIRFRLSLIFLPVTILFLIVGLRKGLIGVAVGYSSATLLYLLILLYQTTIQLDLRFLILFKRLLIFFIPATSMVLISFGLRSFLLSKFFSAWFQLFITLGSSIIFYFIIQYGLFPLQANKFYRQIVSRSTK